MINYERDKTLLGHWRWVAQGHCPVKHWSWRWCHDKRDHTGPHWCPITPEPDDADSTLTWL